MRIAAFLAPIGQFPAPQRPWCLPSELSFEKGTTFRRVHQLLAQKLDIGLSLVSPDLQFCGPCLVKLIELFDDDFVDAAQQNLIGHV